MLGKTPHNIKINRTFIVQLQQCNCLVHVQGVHAYAQRALGHYDNVMVILLPMCDSNKMLRVLGLLVGRGASAHITVRNNHVAL